MTLNPPTTGTRHQVTVLKPDFYEQLCNCFEVTTGKRPSLTLESAFDRHLLSLYLVGTTLRKVLPPSQLKIPEDRINRLNRTTVRLSVQTMGNNAEGVAFSGRLYLPDDHNQFDPSLYFDYEAILCGEPNSLEAYIWFPSQS